MPQLLTNHSRGFTEAVRQLSDYGYHQINLNIGCPSGTVVAKGKGSGQLKDLEKLDRFFEEVFRELSDKTVEISVKTRIGIRDNCEAEELIRLYNRYPLHELIIHPRYQKQFYKGKPDLETFERMLEESVHPVCYNGDIESVADYRRIEKRFPKIKAVMIGRGLLKNPALIRKIQGGAPAQKEEVIAYYKSLERFILETLPEEQKNHFHLKEFWSYFGKLFEGSDKLVKEILKSKDAASYNGAVAVLFSRCEIREEKV